MMKKIILLITSLFFTNYGYTQEEFYFSGCKSDTYTYTDGYGNPQTNTAYYGVKIRFSSGVNDQVKLPSYLLSDVRSITYMSRYDTSSCVTSGSMSSSCCDRFVGDETTVRIDLYNSSGFIENIFPTKVYENGFSSQQFTTEITNHTSSANYQFLNDDNINLDDSYYIKFNLNVQHKPIIYAGSGSEPSPITDPFEVNPNINTGKFALGRGAKIFFPENNATDIDLNPTIKWEKLTAYYKDMNPHIQDITNYQLLVGKKEEIKYLNGSWQGVLYDTGVINKQEVTIPTSKTLEPNTNYRAYVRIIYKGKKFYKKVDFKTRNLKAIQKNIAFYNQGITPNSANPKNYINKGKPIRFKVAVKNELAESLTALQGTLTSSTQGVTINNTTVNFGNITSNTTGWSTSEFEITIDESVADGELLNFTLTTNDQVVSGGPWNSTFSFPISPLQNGDLILLDTNNPPNSNGDGDGTPEPGEKIALYPKISNNSSSTIAKVRGILSSSQEFISFSQSNRRYNVVSNTQEPIVSGDANKSPELPFVVNYSSTVGLQEINLNLELQGNLNNVSGPLLKWENKLVLNEGVTPPPTITSLSPENDGTNVGLDVNLVITFDKEITAVGGKNIYIHKYSDDSIVHTIEATDSKVTIANKTVTINPANDLEGSTEYYVKIDIGAFKDTSNNEFEGINTNTVWKFTTRTNTPPGTPQNVTATAISETSIKVSWNAVTDATTYEVYSCDETTTYTTTETGTSITIPNLAQQTTYDFIVKAKNDVGTSSASSCVSTTTLCNHTWGSPVIYTNSTVAIGIVTIDGQPATEEDKVGVFIGSELRAIGNVVVNNGTAYMAATNIQGETAAEATFKIWDASECKEVPVSYTVQTNPGTTIGTPPNYLPIAGDNTLSKEDYILKGDFKLYPNPTTQSITIQSSVFIENIKIYDLTGRLVKEQKINAKQQKINITSLDVGMYNLVLHAKGKKQSLKVIKK